MEQVRAATTTGGGETEAVHRAGSWRSVALAVGIFALVRWSLGMAGLARFDRWLPSSVIVGLELVITGVFMACGLWVCLALAERLLRPRDYPRTAVLGLLLWGSWVLVFLFGRGLVRALAEALGSRFAQQAFFGSWRAASDVGLVLLAATVGVAVARLIRDKNILLPAAVFAAFADFMVVNYFTVAQAMKTPKGREVVQHVMSAELPALTSGAGGRLQAMATLGMADFLFVAFFFACVHQFRMNRRATVVALFVALTGSLVLVQFIYSLPALIPMGVAFLLANFRCFRLSRDEWVATGVVLGTVAVLGGLFILLR